MFCLISKLSFLVCLMLCLGLRPPSFQKRFLEILVEMGFCIFGLLSTIYRKMNPQSSTHFLIFLLDICEIFYTEKQLTRLDKLINDFIKEHIVKNFYGIGSKEKSYQDLSSEFKSLKVYFIGTKEESLFKSCDQNLEPGIKTNDITKEEFFEESVLEIKDEFDPLTTLDTVALPIEQVDFPAVTICPQGSRKEIVDSVLFRQLKEYIADK